MELLINNIAQNENTNKSESMSVQRDTKKITEVLFLIKRKNSLTAHPYRRVAALTPSIVGYPDLRPLKRVPPLIQSHRVFHCDALYAVRPSTLILEQTTSHFYHTR